MLKRGNSRSLALILFITLIVSIGLIVSASSNETAINNSTDFTNLSDAGVATSENVSLFQDNLTSQEPFTNQTNHSTELLVVNNDSSDTNATQVVNSVLSEVNKVINETPRLATRVNNHSADDHYVKGYLGIYKNFSDIPFQKIKRNATANLKLLVGAKEDNIRGFQVGNDRYAIHLIICNHNTGECAFRVNGVATGPLRDNNSDTGAHSKFSIDENKTLEVTGIQLDYCDGRRFCNVYYEAYDIVNLTVTAK